MKYEQILEVLKSHFEGTTGDITIQQLEKCAGEIAGVFQKNRYDWSKIPDRFNYAATDKDGDAFAFENYPLLGMCCWMCDMKSKVILISEGGSVCADWRESLEKRPTI